MIERTLTSAIILVLFSAGPVIAESRLDWTNGVGMTPCSRLATIDEADLVAWVQGYWAGANLYLGGSDLCRERAAIFDVPPTTIRALIEIQCASLQDQPIMTAAFNALEGLPTLSGSRAAACGGN